MIQNCVGDESEFFDEQEDPYSEGGYTSCGACCGYGCDRCMPEIYLEDED